MTARIFSKLILAVLVVLVVALTAIDLLASRYAEQVYLSGLKAEITEKIQMLQTMERDHLLLLTPQSVRDLAHAAGGRLTVLAPDGSVLLDSEANPAQMENHAGRSEVQEALRGRIGIAERNSATIGVRFLYIAGPVKAGVARLAVPLKDVEDRVAALRRALLLYTTLAFIPAIGLAALFSRYFSRRLGAIIDYASTLATGNFSARLVNQSSDELGVLGRQLNETGEKLQRMFEELQREHVELEKLERIRKDFVINVSHELRTPLASIQGYTETLLDGALEDKENNVRFLNIIRQNAERLGRLTADLLTLSRLELKTQPLQIKNFELNPLIEECLDTLRPIAGRKQIELRFRPAPEATQIFCDSEAIHQVMMNLLDNAIKYTPEHGSITVSAALQGGHNNGESMEIAVQDTGQGIPADDLPRLFERFYRVDKARSRALGGTGLGLAIVKHLVRSMGGEVRVDSVVNQGSTFRFTVPVNDLSGAGKQIDHNSLTG